MLTPFGHWYSCRPVRIQSGLHLKLAVDLGYNTWTRRTFQLYGVTLNPTTDSVAAQHALTQLVSSVQRPHDDRPPSPPPLFLRSIAVEGSTQFQCLLFDTVNTDPAVVACALEDAFPLSLNHILIETKPELFSYRISR